MPERKLRNALAPTMGPFPNHSPVEENGTDEHIVSHTVLDAEPSPSLNFPLLNVSSGGHCPQNRRQRP
jgi:hypothetical protein